MIRTYIRFILEGVGDEDDTPGAQPQVRDPGPRQDAPVGGPTRFSRDHLISARTQAAAVSSAMLLALQGTGDDEQAERVMSLICSSADIDSSYPDEFPICTAVVVCALAEGDLDNAPAIVFAAQELLQQAMKESYKRKKIISESILGAALDETVEKYIRDAISSLVNKKIINVATEQELESVARSIAANDRKLSIPILGERRFKVIPPRDAVTSAVLHSVDISKIQGVKTSVDILARLGDDIGDTASAETLRKCYSGNKMFLIDPQTGRVTGDIGDSAIAIRDRLNVMSPDAADAALGKIGKDRSWLDRTATSLDEDAQGIRTSVSSHLSSRDSIKDLATGSFTRAFNAAKRTTGPAWNDYIEPALSRIAPYVPAKTGNVISTALLAAGSIGAVVQYIKQDPKLRGNYALRVALADEAVYQYFTQWADKQSGNIGSLGELESSISNMFPPENLQYVKTVKIVQSLDEKGGAATGTDVTFG